MRATVLRRPPEGRVRAAFPAASALPGAGAALVPRGRRLLMLRGWIRRVAPVPRRRRRPIPGVAALWPGPGVAALRLISWVTDLRPVRRVTALWPVPWMGLPRLVPRVALLRLVPRVAAVLLVA